MKAVSTSERIRQLARSGMPIAAIARELGIRYQHAYKVCRDSGLGSLPSDREPERGYRPARKPCLNVEHLLANGFVLAGVWAIRGERIACSERLPKSAGVYAYAIDGTVMYVGLASGSLSQRLYFYGNPGASQRTNVRLNKLIREALASGKSVQVLYGQPPAFNWNNLRVSGAEGLEAGIIQDFMLPWNVRGAS